MRRPWPTWGHSATGKNKVKRFNHEGLQVNAHLLRGNINKNTKHAQKKNATINPLNPELNPI